MTFTRQRRRRQPGSVPASTYQKRAASGPVNYWSGKAFASCDPSQWPDDISGRAAGRVARLLRAGA